MSDAEDRDLESAEVLAYELLLFHTPEEERSDVERKWKDEGREGLEFRKLHRQRAEELKSALAECGLRVAKSSSTKVSKRLREILLIPAKEAYVLEEELRPKADPRPQLPG